MVSGLEWKRDRASIRLDQVKIDFGLEVAGELAPSFLGSGHREEHLVWKHAADIIVGIEHPKGNPVRFTGVNVSSSRVVVVEPLDSDTKFTLVISICDTFDFLRRGFYRQIAILAHTAVEVISIS